MFQTSLYVCFQVILMILSPNTHFWSFSNKYENVTNSVYLIQYLDANWAPVAGTCSTGLVPTCWWCGYRWSDRCMCRCFYVRILWFVLSLFCFCPLFLLSVSHSYCNKGKLSFGFLEQYYTALQINPNWHTLNNSWKRTAPPPHTHTHTK